MALRVGRLDLLRGTARVVEAAPEVDGRLHWGGVKTHEARTVRLPRSVANELGGYLAGRPRDAEALVFTAPLGGPLRPHTWVKSFFKPALRVAGLPEALRLYDLRHTCASLLIAQGASVKAVQAQLGHATASITLDTYGHLFPCELEALADRLEETRMAALANRSGPSADQQL
jgi:integrase